MWKSGGIGHGGTSYRRVPLSWTAGSRRTGKGGFRCMWKEVAEAPTVRRICSAAMRPVSFLLQSANSARRGTEFPATRPEAHSN